MARYLIVDDSRTIRLAVGAALKQAGGIRTEVYEAEDTAGALTHFREKKPDIVFLDMMLAQGSKGLDALNAMLEERPDARIVIMTGLAPDHPDVVAAISHGAFAHIQKPVRLEAVKTVLSQVEAESGRLGRIR